MKSVRELLAVVGEAGYGIGLAVLITLIGFAVFALLDKIFLGS
jgi:hypothetical protein